MSEIWSILGVDASKWQGKMNWAQTKAAGARFAFIRAGSITKYTGQMYKDSRFDDNSNNAPLHLPVGFYWYFRPNHDPVKQADYFCDLIENADWRLPPVIDIEEDGLLSPSGVTNAAVKFVARVYDRFNVWSLIYSRSFFMRDEMNYHALLGECDTWIARYTSKPKPYGNPNDHPGFVPPWGKHCVAWQYVANSDAAVQYGGEGPPGGSDDIDLNRFHGTEEEFAEWIGVPAPMNEIIISDNNGNLICKGDIPQGTGFEFNIQIREK